MKGKMPRSGWAFGAALALLHCVPRYEEPELPTHRMALVEVEKRATVRTVDGAQPLNGADTSRKFWVSPACHTLDVRYETRYMRTKEFGGILVWGRASLAATAVLGVASAVALMAQFAEHTHVATYETNMPILFKVPAKPGMKNWVTSTFTGDVFIPRVAVVNAANERVAVILPNQPCG
jgi:hypothetical protein